MNENSPSKVLYNSFEEFQRTFYPETAKAQESQETGESYARDLAKYAVEKHFPPPVRHD